MRICEFCGDDSEIHVPAGSECLRRLTGTLAELTRQMDNLRQANLNLRVRIHELEHHRERFHACESAWCNPVEDWDPALQGAVTNLFSSVA
jgi:hypothetical protein